MPIEDATKRKPFVPEKIEEVGRIERKNSSDLVVRVSLYKGEKWIDIRNWVKTEKYTGWSEKGIAFKEENLSELIKLLQKARKK